MSLAESLPLASPLTEERADLAAAFRWSARLDFHEGIANHFSLAVNDDGSQFLINPKNRHFERIRASELLLLDANDPSTMDRPDAPDPTAWGLHGAVHRLCPHARCAVHLHPPFGTVLACLADPKLPPINQTAAAFFGAQAIDMGYDGLAFEEEAERTCALLADPLKTVLIMGNHGIMTIGRTVGEAFDRMYYFERACKNYIQALWTGKPLNMLSDSVAQKTFEQLNDYGDVSDDHLREIRAILDAEGCDYAS
ncbi:MAG: class II aldolase and adducin N-terminal domain-containing protein [Pseudomonadota bacterium]